MASTLMASTLMATPRTRTALRIAFVGLLTASVCAFAPLPGALAVADGLPQELLGFRLGERVDAVKGSSGTVAVKSRPMVVLGRHNFSFAPPTTAGVVLYQDCPVRVDTRCTPGPENTSGDRPDTPGSVRLFVASFSEARLLGLAFELNKRRWGSTPLEKAAELLSKSYGRPTKASPVRREVTKTPQVHIVTASTSWQWEDRTVRLLVRGLGNNMPGTTIPGIGHSSYSYFLYLERLDLRRMADQRVPKGGAQGEK
ncbi:MAG TPA: hypothetical protein VNC82_13530 [Candidatus Limnocylindria bacterium]|nr:hypothetical protein [Candidatus Limnocylindria bacterium]